MRLHAVALDYDGTLAVQGKVAASTVAALRRLKESGRRLVLVTGRELDDLRDIFPELTLFDRVVAENGALMQRSEGGDLVAFGEPPQAEFLKELDERGVPWSAGQRIVSTRTPYETAVLAVVRDLGLDMPVVFNKGAVMILPPGVNKGSGLVAALSELGLSRHDTVGVGDAENDHAFLVMCEVAVAVADALPTVKARADWVTHGGAGAGVEELAERLLTDDLAEVTSRSTRHDIALGTANDGTTVTMPPRGPAMLLAGGSGAGKTTLSKVILERLLERGYQTCVLDPEGDYEGVAGLQSIGGVKNPPVIDEVMSLLEQPEPNLRICLLGLPLADRPRFFTDLLGRVEKQRTTNGRPHWLVIDEAHHGLPADGEPLRSGVEQALHEVLLVTLHPDKLPPGVRNAIGTMIAVGEDRRELMTAFASATGRSLPPLPANGGDTWLWRPGERVVELHVLPPRAQHLRHRRKYADGDLGRDRSFYFEGPAGKLKLRAPNVILFAHIAEGVDDDTFDFHLGRRDYSRWFRDDVKDEALAAVVAQIEDAHPPAEEARAQVLAAIGDRYTLPG